MVISDKINLESRIRQGKNSQLMIFFTLLYFASSLFVNLRNSVFQVHLESDHSLLLCHSHHAHLLVGPSHFPSDCFLGLHP